MHENVDVPSAGMNLITKSMAVLQALAQYGELTVHKLAEHTGEPASSLYRLLATLEAIGWTEQGSHRGRVRLGLDFLRLGAKLENQLDLRQLALPELRKLHDATGETAFLCIRRGMRAVCIERIDGLDVQIHSLRLGESLPLGEGVAPRAILAFEPGELVESYFRGAASESPASAIAPDREILRGLLEETVSSGVAVAEAEWANGIGGVGAPIFNYKGHVVAALSISGLSQRLFSGDYDAVGLVRDAAQTVSRNLGAEILKERT